LAGIRERVAFVKRALRRSGVNVKEMVE